MSPDDLQVLHSIATKLLAFEARDVPDSIASRNERQRLDAARDRAMTRYLRDWIAQCGADLLSGSTSGLAVITSCLTPAEARALRQILAPSKKVLTRVLTRGAIRSEREFHAIRAWIDELEGDASRSDELARAYQLIEQFESAERRETI